MNGYDIIIVGGGHAGCEAAWACSSRGMSVLLVTMSRGKIGLMSCNPAVGGIAKGHLVKEIDAFGGIMALATDQAGIQFRRLNEKKGPAVRGTRAQVDRRLYAKKIQEKLDARNNISIKECLVERILTREGRVSGVLGKTGEEFSGRAVILCPGTFLSGLMHVGLDRERGGRDGDLSADGLPESLRSLGIELGRMKTGTTPRLDKKSIDFSGLDVQAGDVPAPMFSLESSGPRLPQVTCHLTRTNEETHRIIRENLDRSPLFCGVIKGKGPRYCPSIEDKVVRFPERRSHYIFLEPDGLETDEIYPNGISTSLPADVQEKFVRTILGLENARILRPGYAVEYDFAPPTQLYSSLMTKAVKGLFFAGQINGTSGYEEAAAQGLVAGINACLYLQEKESLVLKRSEAYMGVMIDDLTTRGTSEPYRMFTSRAEFRLLLREDNAYSRLSEKAHVLGLLDPAFFERVRKLEDEVRALRKRIEETMLSPSAPVNAWLEEAGTAPMKKQVSLADVLRRPEIDVGKLTGRFSWLREFSASSLARAETEIKYHGYLEREMATVSKMNAMEEMKIPNDLQYSSLSGLSKEVVEKLEKVRPGTIGQASRIPGVTPAATTILLVHVTKLKKKRPGK